MQGAPMLAASILPALHPMPEGGAAAQDEKGWILFAGACSNHGSALSGRKPS
jgi:hypothetical protein